MQCVEEAAILPELLREGRGLMADAQTITATEKAVRQLKAYGRYITTHAENIVGNIDRPNYVLESGIRISFTLDCNSWPVLEVNHEYLVPYMDNWAKEVKQ